MSLFIIVKYNVVKFKKLIFGQMSVKISQLKGVLLYYWPGGGGSSTNFVRICATQTFGSWLSLYLLVALLATHLYTIFFAKSTQICPNWVLFRVLLAKIPPMRLHWKPTHRYTKIAENAPQNGGTYPYTFQDWRTPSPRDYRFREFETVF